MLRAFHLSLPKTEPRVVADATGPIRKIIKNHFRIDPLLVLGRKP